MTTAIAALIGYGKYVSKGVHEQVWNANVSGRGNYLDAAALPDKTVHILGPSTGGGSSRIILEGTNESYPTTPTARWTTLTSPTDGDFDFTAMVTVGIIRALRENPRYIRPHFETVTTGETLGVIIISR